MPASHSKEKKEPIPAPEVPGASLEEALIRSQRLASMGRMAAAIAHEIKNPLAAVMNLLFLAQHNPECPQSIKDDLAKAQSELNRISHITRQVLGFYRDSCRPTAVLVADVLDEALALFETKIIAKGVEIAKDYSVGVKITIVAGELRQVFSNIIANSLDAVPDDGKIKFRIAEKMTSAGRNVARITLADNGKGIEASALPHIFEPLFTTKESVGTGLGLWVSKQLVEKHHGRICFRSSTRPERRGTTFVVEVPTVSIDSPV
jgi:signal transduction histidine kinase